MELYEGLAEAGVPVLGGDTSAAESLVLSVTALGRSERVPGRGGARPGDALVVTGRSAPPAPPSARSATPGRRSGSTRVAVWLRPRTRCSTSRTASPRDAGHIAARSGCHIAIDLERVPLAPGATVDDLGFGEDYELLAAVPDAGGFTEIGRCEEGEGVELRLHGAPVSLAGCEHFGGR